MTPREYFGFELRGFGADLQPAVSGARAGAHAEYIVESTTYGGVRKNHRDYSTTPELIDYGIKSARGLGGGQGAACSRASPASIGSR